MTKHYYSGYVREKLTGSCFDIMTSEGSLRDRLFEGSRELEGLNELDFEPGSDDLKAYLAIKTAMMDHDVIDSDQIRQALDQLAVLRSNVSDKVTEQLLFGKLHADLHRQEDFPGLKDKTSTALYGGLLEAQGFLNAGGKDLGAFLDKLSAVAKDAGKAKFASYVDILSQDVKSWKSTDITWGQYAWLSRQLHMLQIAVWFT